MHVIPIPHPPLRLPTHLRFRPTRIPRRGEPGPEMVDEVFDDEAGFGEDEGFGGRGRGDADDGGFAERVDFFQFRGRELGLAFVGLQRVG